MPLFLAGLIKKERTQLKNLIAVGDFVKILPEGSSHGSIVQIEERFSTLSRQDISGKNRQLIAVNIDQVLIIASLVEPPLKPALIDRYLIAAEKGGMHPIIVVNKIDLLESADPEMTSLYRDFLASYEPLGYPILSISVKTGVGIEPLRSLMKDKASVFSGQSGVGKSSLLNAAFGFELKTGGLTQKTAKGSHTTSTSQLLRLPQGGFCIDTPGIRSFGIWDLHKDDLASHFSEFLPFAPQCRYPDCTHLNEPSCAVKTALESGLISQLRFESYKNLLEEILAGLDNRAKKKIQEFL